IFIGGCSLVDTGAGVIDMEEGVVTKNVDGDTIYAKINGKDEKIRLILVNTPESTTKKEPYGKEAAIYTKENLYIGRKIYLEKDVSDTDKYGRLLRYVWTEKPKEINKDEIKDKMYNAQLLINGYAQVSTFPPDVKYVDYFRQYQTKARKSASGLWGLHIYSKEDRKHEKLPISDDVKVYYTPNGKAYHITKDCKSLSKSKTIKNSKLGDIKNIEGKGPCSICVK
ncbi:MAG: thermonuclease family protein, partial [Clostridium sp.]